MKLRIDNGDGKGWVDYTPAVLTAEPLTVERERGRLARCTAGLDVVACALPVPAEGGRVQVLGGSGKLLFSGYVTRDPLRPMALQRDSGSWQAARLEAAEEAWLTGSTASLAGGLQPANSVEHSIDPAEHAVTLHPAKAETLAMCATDISVSGGIEAAAYVTELFQGDGTTAAFVLMDPPFREAGSGTLLTESFEADGFAANVWKPLDPGGYIGIGSAGLRVAGGNGFDGQTVLRALNLVEMGGTLTAELTGVQLQQGSDGVLLGMYSNAVTMPNCFAGFRVKGTAGARTLVAFVNGTEQGSPFPFAEGHRYTLRLRLHSPEIQRVPCTYQALVGGAVQTFGRGGGAALVESPMRMVFEVEDLGLASSTVATVLYAVAVAISPAACVFAPMNSVDLLCEAGGCTLRQHGSAYVESTMQDGTVLPRREGAPESGADFRISGNTLLFYPGRMPAPNERVVVSYRRGRRSSARLQDADALALRMNQGLPALPAWSCSVHSPAPRSSADCRNAAAALLTFATDPATGVAGECTVVNPENGDDVQPGDRLLLPIRGANCVPISVQSVTLRDGNAVPEVMTYRVHFGQDRANGLSFSVSDGLADDLSTPLAVTPEVSIAGLSALQVVSATDAALQMDAGTAAPNGGGFEVRRRDGGFGSGDADLVLLSPVRSFSVPRAGFRERFYVRMYDGSQPPAYSAWSSVVVTHLPVS